MGYTMKYYIDYFYTNQAWHATELPDITPAPDSIDKHIYDAENWSISLGIVLEVRNCDIHSCPFRPYTLSFIAADCLLCYACHVGPFVLVNA